MRRKRKESTDGSRLALVSLALQPAAHAEDKKDKKKKKEMTKADYDQQWKLEQMQRNQAAQAVVPRRIPQAPGRMLSPAVPLNTVAEDADYNIVHLYNQTGGPVQVVQVSADGSTVKDFGTIPPFGLSGNSANQLRTKAGMMWAFEANGQVLMRYTVTTAPQQEITIRESADLQPHECALPGDPSLARWQHDQELRRGPADRAGRPAHDLADAPGNRVGVHGPWAGPERTHRHRCAAAAGGRASVARAESAGRIPAMHP